VVPEVRDDRVCWIDPQRATRRQASWLARMEGLRRALNQRLYLGLMGFEGHLAVYPPGARYHTHVDRFADASHRRVSVLLYLNEAWQPDDGGHLRLHLGEADREPFRDVTPRGGSLVAFLSDAVPHEVLPARRERWSLAGWFTNRH
jgi:SM-20-related protein